MAQSTFARAAQLALACAVSAALCGVMVRPKASPVFEGRVAHGYLILSFAAGLFVDPDPGPVLANTGLENLRFLTPLYPGDSMRVELSVRSKSLKSEETGVVRWAVEIFNQRDELVATYDLLTENVP